MLSLTVRHGICHHLKTVRQGLARAHSRLVRGEPWKRFKRLYGIRHFIRAHEVTHGPNGWHPHLHVQLFLDCALSSAQLDQAMVWLQKRWAACVVRELGAEHAPNDERGVDLRPSRRGDYGFKMALELFDVGTKRARPNHRTPWQIAGDYASIRLEADGALWQDYCNGMRGAQMHHWSNGLREAVHLGAAKTEQEIVDGERALEEEVVAVIDPSGWVILMAQGAEGVLHVLEVAERSDTAAACDGAIRRSVCGARGS